MVPHDDDVYNVTYIATRKTHGRGTGEGLEVGRNEAVKCDDGVGEGEMSERECLIITMMIMCDIWRRIWMVCGKVRI